MNCDERVNHKKVYIANFHTKNPLIHNKGSVHSSGLKSCRQKNSRISRCGSQENFTKTALKMKSPCRFSDKMNELKTECTSLAVSPVEKNPTLNVSLSYSKLKNLIDLDEYIRAMFAKDEVPHKGYNITGDHSIQLLNYKLEAFSPLTQINYSKDIQLYKGCFLL